MYEPLEPDCRFCKGQSDEGIFDPERQMLEMEMSRRTFTYVMHNHGQGIILLAYKQTESGPLEYVDGFTGLQVLRKALEKLTPLP